MEEQEVRARTRQETHDRNRRRNNHCAVPIRWRPIRRSLRSACGNGVFPPRPARRSSGSHAAARHALEHALQLGRAVREAVAPEAIARVLDELYESDQKPPLSTTRIDNGRDRGGQGGGGEREASGYVLYGRGGPSQQGLVVYLHGRRGFPVLKALRHALAVKKKSSTLKKP